MTSSFNNDENKFLVFLVLCTFLLFCSILCSCSSTKKTVDRYHERVDSTMQSSSTVDHTDHRTINVDSLVHLVDSMEREHKSHIEYNDTIYKHFIDHQVKESDSVSVKVDSVTGVITFHYYSRTYEREIISDTIRIERVVRDSVYMDRKIQDRLYKSGLVIDSLNHELLQSDSLYHALKDSIDSQVTVTEKRSWWDKARSAVVDMTICLVFIGIIIIAVFITIKKTKQ